jgi:hypothetical protein
MTEGIYSRHWVEENCMQSLRGKPEGKKHLEDICIEEMTVLKGILKIKTGGRDVKHMAQNRNTWPTLID